MELHVEVWMRRCKGGYQYRGMVRDTKNYLYQGEWLRTQQDAARDGNKAAKRIDEKDRKRVIH